MHQFGTAVEANNYTDLELKRSIIEDKYELFNDSRLLNDSWFTKRLTAVSFQ